MTIVTIMTTNMKKITPGEKEFTAKNNNSFEGIRLREDEIIPFRKGDLLGFVNEGNIGNIGYHFEVVPMYTASVNASHIPGGQAFSEIFYPFKFATAITYKPGPQYETTTEEKTITSSGTASSTPTVSSTSQAEGSTTTSSKTFPPKPAKSTAKSPNAVASTEKETWLSVLSDNPYVILALLIWAVLITLILLCYCCCKVHKSHQRRRNPYNRYPSYRSSGEFSSTLKAQQAKDDLGLK
jgi:hypothetical protein